MTEVIRKRIRIYSVKGEYMKKAMIAMSGGVDSSVAAYIIKEKGYDVTGITMQLYHNEDIGVKDKTCCSLDDVLDARSVANKLDIPFYVLNFSNDFKKEVIERFVNAYKVGLTPNPCIDCNRYIKFNKLFHRAKELGFDYVVTGHYAKVEFDEKTGRYLLKKSVDDKKDQSYVLYSLTQAQLKMLLLPLGELTKTKTREIAENNGFVNAKKHDSQDICFVPDGDYCSFIENWCSCKFEQGDFVDTDGNFISKHKGIIGYTIGQRKGLGIAAAEPLYVLKKDSEKNTVVLGSNEELFSTHLTAKDLNWISIDNLTEPLKVKAKIRYKHNESEATVTPLENGEVAVDFLQPQRAITSGQAVVFYNGDIVVGGGTII